MRSWFYEKGYPKSLAEKEVGRVKFSGYTKRKKKREKTGVPFVTTYHQSLKSIRRFISQNIFSIRMKSLKKFLQRLVDFLSRCEKTQQLLSQGKALPFRRTVGSFQCQGKQCQTCNNVKEAEMFISTTPDDTITLNHKLNYNGKCLAHFSLFNYFIGLTNGS